MSYPVPVDEQQRLQDLQSYDILDTAAEAAYDALVKLAAYICGTPVALVSLVDRQRQWFKSAFGFDCRETPRDVAFCAHAICQPSDVMIVEDAPRDARFADNPLVTGDPHIRFYAGAPLVSRQGHALGTLCVIDTVPRHLSAEQCEALRTLSQAVITQLELRRSNHELSERNRHLEQMALLDPLTGLFNRRALDLRLREEMQRHRRHGQACSLLLLDVDRFKDYNDSFGHLCGDELLRRLAACLRTSLRGSDIVCRYGGEEFVVILPATAGPEADFSAARLCQDIAASDWPCRPITVSVGVATAADDDDAVVLLERADRALYWAKEHGRNRAVHSDKLTTIVDNDEVS